VFLLFALTPLSLQLDYSIGSGAPVVTKGIDVGSPLTFPEKRCAEVGVEWGMCDPPLFSGRKKTQRANSRVLLIAGCLVGLPYISHMVTHMQRGAGRGCGAEIVPLSCRNAKKKKKGGAETPPDLLSSRS
jgi:hypothetical protein